jgi:hypothetical protein
MYGLTKPADAGPFWYGDFLKFQRREEIRNPRPPYHPMVPLEGETRSQVRGADLASRAPGIYPLLVSEVGDTKHIHAMR